MLPVAPGLFSTTTAWPHFSCSFCPTARARMSAVPPGGDGTMNLMGLAGHACAAASVEAAASAGAAVSGFPTFFILGLSCGQRRSVGGDVAVPDDLAVALAVGIDERGELRGRAANRDRAL